MFVGKFFLDLYRTGVHILVLLSLYYICFNVDICVTDAAKGIFYADLAMRTYWSIFGFCMECNQFINVVKEIVVVLFLLTEASGSTERQSMWQEIVTLVIVSHQLILCIDWEGAAVGGQIRCWWDAQEQEEHREAV